MSGRFWTCSGFNWNSQNFRNWENSNMFPHSSKRIKLFTKIHVQMSFGKRENLSLLSWCYWPWSIRIAKLTSCTTPFHNGLNLQYMNEGYTDFSIYILISNWTLSGQCSKFRDANHSLVVLSHDSLSRFPFSRTPTSSPNNFLVLPRPQQFLSIFFQTGQWSIKSPDF